MEEEKLEIAEIGSAEKCESIQELGESSVSVDGERDGTVLIEDKPVDATGGEEGGSENHVAVEKSESIVEAVSEMIKQPVVVGEEEGGGEMLMKAEEEAKRVDDVKGEAVVIDTGDTSLFAEAQVDTGGDELLVDPKIKMKAEEEFAPATVTELKMVVTDFESQMDARGDELPVDPQLGKKAEEEFPPEVDSKVEVVVTDVGDAQQLSELQMDARGNELQVAMEGMEAWDYKSEREMGDREDVEAGGGVDNQLVDSWMVENNSEMVVKGYEVDEEKAANVVVNDSEVETAEKPAGTEEEKVYPMITEEVPIAEFKMDAEIITEVNACVVNVGEQEQVHELSGGVENVSGNASYEHADDKDVAAEGSLRSGTKVVEDERMGVEVLMDSKLGESVNVAENKEDSEVKEELPAGDINTETEAGVKLALTRKVAEEEIQLTDAEEETEMGTEVAADKIPDEDGKMEAEETMSDVDEPGQDIYDSPVALQDEEDEAMVAEEEIGTQDTEMETETDIAESGKTSGGKRKRGKFSKSPSNSKATAKTSSRKTVGEDVCFICFDGGELVLCDRRGCPKAYHPSCVNRDEAFFRSKGRWNCGWHLCSICEKNARYMCYTCTFSLCKSCIKDAVILCVRGNKGFCETCMRTVMLIENNAQGDNDTQIDFDDRSSWEYLFKDYYIELKAKLSLSTVEIAEAKNPWKGADVLSGPSKQESSEAQADANDGGSGSDDSIENLETIRPKRRKVRKQSKSVTKGEESVSTDVAAVDKASSLSDNSEWASKELLEFVSHMKNGDTSILSQFDVQALLLEYIKTNKLRDPRRKSQIICDARLENLFGKPRVGHFEMLKLLESHFLIRDEHNDDIQGSVVDTENNQLDIDGGADPLTKGVKDRKRKSRKKDRGPQSNLDDYAAIDMHNIGLIYLRRKLMEDLLEDAETFHDKVIGTFVRIRISGSTQKQDLYRLVQVVGTSKAAEPYKVGKRTTDTMVEILNLDKTEIISIDTISNQEFTEEECKRLRQSIKCGLINRLTVGEILDKTMEIQAARVNDWLESEILRLSHLRDRASDLGRRKELRECVEKLQLLKTPEERRRRLDEIPEIHADPKMDPSYESDDNDSEAEDSRRDAFMRSRGSGFSRRGRAPISPGSENSVKDSWSGAGKVTSKNWESGRHPSGNNFSINASHIGEIVNENSWNLERDKEIQESNNLEKLNSAANSAIPSATSQTSLSAAVVETSVKINESEKIWHYKDPSGKVQGPFSMVQLRKWNNTGYFPADLRIWRTTEKQDNAILLADALAGKFPKELPAVDNVLPATNILHSSHTLAGHSGKTSTVSLYQDKERANMDQQNSGSISKLSTEKWLGNDITNLPSPTPKQSNAGWTGGEGGLLTGAIQSPNVNGVLPSPTAVIPSIGTQSSAPASVLNSIVQTAFSPTPNSQQGIMAGPTVSLHTQATTISEPHLVQMHGHPLAPAQPVQTVINQNIQADTQGWGSNAQSGQPHGYGWGTPNILNSSGGFSNSGTPSVPNSSGSFSNSGTPSVANSSGSFSNSGTAAGHQHDVWRPTPASQPNMHHPPATPNASWGMGPTESSNTSMGMRPENPNIGWSTMQANPNMGWGNPAPGNTNMNWGPAMQAPPPGNTTSGWIAPPGNTGANIQGMIPGNIAPSGNAGPNIQGMIPGKVAPSGNAGPNIQGMVPGNVTPSGNTGANIQGMVPGNVTPSGNAGANIQGMVPGNPNSGWAANQGWGGPPVQGQVPGNGWAPPSGNAGPPPAVQGPPQGNTNPGWGPPSGNQGPWGGEQNHMGGQFSGPRGGQGRDAGGFSGGRPWNRQSSFGGGGGGGGSRHVSKRDTICPYNANGRCKKGARCDYLHT